MTRLTAKGQTGYEVKAWEFMKISIPFTLTAVASGYVLIWLLWGPSF